MTIRHVASGMEAPKLLDLLEDLQHVNIGGKSFVINKQVFEINCTGADLLVALVDPKGFVRRLLG